MVRKLTEFDCKSIRAALGELKPGDTLALGGGIHHIYSDGAERRFYFISNNDSGEKDIAFPLIGMKDVTIDGEGAQLIFHGDILPFAVDSSENVVIKNLSVDYSSPKFAQAEIIAADRYRTTLRFSGEFGCRVGNDGSFCFYSEKDCWEHVVEKGLALEFAKVDFAPRAIPSPSKPPYFPYTGKKRDHGFLGGMYKDVILEQKSHDTIIMHGTLGFEHTVGNYLVITHASREYPAFLLTEAKDVTLENIRIYYSTGMGVIGQLSENLTLDRLVCEPAEGSARLLSVNADATHFVNCRGKIELKGCKLVSMMDDATNIHGIYAIVDSLDGARTLKCRFGHPQQRGIKICRPGDRIAVIDRDKTATLATRTVVSCELSSPDELTLELDEKLPPLAENCLVENLSTAPEVHIHDCETGFNRPRGFLLSSGGKIVVERCKFYNMHQGINVGCEMKDWFESGAVNDVTVRDCSFENSAYAGGWAISVRPNIYEKAPRDFYFGRIAIENNRFVQSGRRIARVDLAASVVLHGNSFELDASLPYHGEYGSGGLELTNCGRIDSDSE